MLTAYEELSLKRPEVFRKEDLLALDEGQVFVLQELSFLDRVNFIYQGGQYLLWIDWLDAGQLDQVAGVLLKTDDGVILPE